MTVTSRPVSNSNGIIRITRKGLKKFAFGEEGAPFEVDIVRAFQAWLAIDEQLRTEETEDGKTTVPTERMPEYHQAAVEFVQQLATDPVKMESPILTPAEALDFLARLREQYDELAHFFRPRSREEQDSPDTLEAPSALQFSEEEPSKN